MVRRQEEIVGIVDYPRCTNTPSLKSADPVGANPAMGDRDRVIDES